MITEDELYNLAKCRFAEAKVLISSIKPDGALYLCGYALELILKRHIVKVLQWDGYPETSKDFEGLQSFKTHDLETLLKLSGLKNSINSDDKLLTSWKKAISWNSELRYKRVGEITENEAKETIEEIKKLLNYIYPLKINS